jgi:hypothetical protein
MGTPYIADTLLVNIVYMCISVYGGNEWAMIQLTFWVKFNSLFVQIFLHQAGQFPLGCCWFLAMPAVEHMK